MAKWLRFDEAGFSASGKTRRWNVIAVDGMVQLGTIVWFASWRKYVFEPWEGTIYEWQCLRDIAFFCEQQTQTHKAAKVS